MSAVQPNPEVERIVADVCHELADHFRAGAKHGPDYARRYATAAMSAPSNGTARTLDLHPDVAHLIRELVQEQLCFERRSGYSNDHRKAA